MSVDIQLKPSITVGRQESPGTTLPLKEGEAGLSECGLVIQGGLRYKLSSLASAVNTR